MRSESIHEELERPSKHGLIEYIRSFEKRIADIEVKLNPPSKAACNSERLPAQDEKADEHRTDKCRKIRQRR
jgi:hypothetical protein